MLGLSAALPSGYPWSDTPWPHGSSNCTAKTKQKALYLGYSFSPSLEDTPAFDIAVEQYWNATSDMRRYGKNGVFAAQPIHTSDGVSGYFGSQADGEPSSGGLLFSIWDAKRKSLPSPADCVTIGAPNATWCGHKHSFPLSTTCRRHCLDCGLHPGWHNTSGTQCSIQVTLSEGDRLRFRLRRMVADVTYVDHAMPAHAPYSGSEWELSATKLSGGCGLSPWSGNCTLVVGRMFWEDTHSGISRFGAFHEHIGCTPCDAFYESEVRGGPWVQSPSPRVANISFKPPTSDCELFSVELLPSKSAAQFRTGPGSTG
jgi:hypothetical protein